MKTDLLATLNNLSRRSLAKADQLSTINCLDLEKPEPFCKSVCHRLQFSASPAITKRVARLSTNEFVGLRVAAFALQLLSIQSRDC
jgi:hypothetical protein